MNLVDVHNMHIGFKKGEQLQTVVHGVDFHINPHEILALVGESGGREIVDGAGLAAPDFEKHDYLSPGRNPV